MYNFFNPYVRAATGTTGILVEKMLPNSTNDRTYSECLFQPKDLVKKSATVITAPLAFAVWSTVLTLDSIVKICDAGMKLDFSHINSRANKKTEEQLIDGLAGATLALTFSALAIVSPIINLTDLLGSTINSATNIMYGSPEDNTDEIIVASTHDEVVAENNHAEVIKVVAENTYGVIDESRTTCAA